MEHNILIIGGNGLVGKTIARILQKRNPHLNIFIGGRRGGNTDRSLKIDLTDPNSFHAITDHKIELIILSVNDKSDHVLQFAIKNHIDYLDITKPTPDLMKAYDIAKKSDVSSRIVFSSGWMGGIVPGLVNVLSKDTDDIQAVKLFVYYSVKDLAGESSAHFMAENVAVPFHDYKNDKPNPVRHFLNTEPYEFSFGIGKRDAYNFDVPDLYILNRVERIPNVSVKMTYNSKFITWLLGSFQYLRIYNILSLKERKMIFGSSGNGDQAVFEVLVQDKNGHKKLSLQSTKGQAELTALSAVLHTEELLRNPHENNVYFSHQLHEPLSLLAQLDAYETINTHIAS
ncbi:MULTISPECIES: NAD-dependent epimerase/dehydratase family protein [unclassified Chryseobacterium]|uniref:NAD-dependent epimerase/dehydratase family protein n=1 Tax=unclassified Chryseobacterium TaxID=2593645 RepID=UPI00100BED38|nr:MULTISPECIES: NAD-dependent epimerase/dehydratase family protein [unclassified Chryseobacterium]RXM51656.1 saccharopine dehydrogenase [Chryseobacterium sp. CH25]RXM67233.1 saccharopine dehydrogenase [Chryseobacterium sp. CH1]